MRGTWLAIGGVLGVGCIAGCGGDSAADPGSGGQVGTGGAAGAGAGGVAGSSGAAGSFQGVAGCSAEPPAGADQAAPLPAYGGTCPTLAAGENSITSSGAERKFRLALPADLKTDESPPIIFLWHWLGGDAEDFYERGEVQKAVDSQRFIAVLPEKKGDVLFTWPMDALSSQARLEEELRFFDDMLACVGAQFSVNRNCVSTVGVSAGALWSAQLAGARGQHLSSFISLSGGTGGTAIKPWKPSVHAMPAIVLWGGPTDTCQGILSFQTMSGDLENGLQSGGHFFLECVHNCGHSEPPFSGGASAYEGLWQFVLDHPFWLPAGYSPYSQALPSTLPAWCGIGKGSAVPRTGACDNPSQC